jgi:hypothetical protein
MTISDTDFPVPIAPAIMPWRLHSARAGRRRVSLEQSCREKFRSR